MQTKITTKDQKTVTITHRDTISDAEINAVKEMIFERLYHVGWICGIKLED